MISEFQEIEELFKELDKVIHKKIKVYAIGGAVLLKQGLKDITKDIDLIVDTKEEFIEFQKALKKIDFNPQIPGQEYKHMNLSQIFVRGSFRIDIFHKKVCGRFSLSERMIKRAESVINLNYLHLFFCSNEDVFLFKTMTERDGDIVDCIKIAKRAEPGWKIILEELQSQMVESKQDVWITWVGERFDLLEEKGLIIPIMNKLNKLRKKFFDDYEKQNN